MIKFTVDGNPCPAQRMTRRSKWSKEARKSLAWQESVAYAWLQEGGVKLKGPVEIKIKFYRRTKHVVDIDNLAKAILDGIQYGKGFEKGDHQVWRLEAEKHYDKENPRVEVWVRRTDDT